MVVRNIVSLTFVLTHACATLAAPKTPSPDFNEPPPKYDSPTPESESKIQSLDIAPPPPAVEADREPEFFYRYRHAISFHAGFAYDTKSAAEGKPILSRFGAQYLFPVDLKSYEAGADLLSDGAGVIHASRRWIYTRTKLRPYSKAGVGLRIVPADQLATFLKYDNYQIRGAIGFEEIVNVPTSFRMELEAMASTRSAQVSLLFGGVWAW